VVLVTANFTWLGLVGLVPRKSAHWYNITTEEKKRGLSLKSIGLRLHRRPAAAKIGVELFRVSDPSSTPAVSAEPSFRQSNPAHGVFMRLSPEIHVPDPHSPEPAILGVLKPPEKPLTRPGTSAQGQLRPIHTGIRESRFNATVGVQLLGHLNFVAVEQSPSL
jgi:hypothetical protein